MRVLGAAQVRAGAVELGLGDLRRGIAELEAMRVEVQLPAALIALADALLGTRDVSGAAEAAGRALPLARRNAARAAESRALLLLGLCGQRGAAGVSVAQARDYLTAGLALAEHLGMAPMAARFRDALAAPVSG